MPGIGSYLERMRNSVSSYGSGAPQQQSAAGQMAGQLADAAGQAQGMPVQTPSSRFGDALSAGLSNPMFQTGVGMLLGSQKGGAGPLAGALGGAMNWQALQLAAQKNALALKEADARLEGLQLGNKEKRQLAAGREQFASLQRQNPNAAPADLLRLWAASSGDPKAVQAWAQVAQRDDQRQQIADYRQQLLDQRQQYHDALLQQGDQRLGIQQAEADRRAATAGKPGQPKQRSLGSTRDMPLGNDMYQRQELTAQGWQLYGQPFRRSSNPLAELLGEPAQAAPQGPAAGAQGGVNPQEVADRQQAAQLLQGNPGLRSVLDQRLKAAYGRGL